MNCLDVQKGAPNSYSMNCTETSKENLYNDAGAERVYIKFLVVVLISILNLKYISVVRDSQSHENKTKRSIHLLFI